MVKNDDHWLRWLQWFTQDYIKNNFIIDYADYIDYQDHPGKLFYHDCPDYADIDYSDYTDYADIQLYLKNSFIIDYVVMKDYYW